MSTLKPRQELCGVGGEIHLLKKNNNKKKDKMYWCSKTALVQSANP